MYPTFSLRSVPSINIFQSIISVQQPSIGNDYIQFWLYWLEAGLHRLDNRGEIKNAFISAITYVKLCRNAYITAY